MICFGFRKLFPLITTSPSQGDKIWGTPDLNHEWRALINYKFHFFVKEGIRIWFNFRLVRLKEYIIFRIFSISLTESFNDNCLTVWFFPNIHWVPRILLSLWYLSFHPQSHNSKIYFLNNTGNGFFNDNCIYFRRFNNCISYLNQ